MRVKQFTQFLATQDVAHRSRVHEGQAVHPKLSCTGSRQIQNQGSCMSVVHVCGFAWSDVTWLYGVYRTHQPCNNPTAPHVPLFSGYSEHAIKPLSYSQSAWEQRRVLHKSDQLINLCHPGSKIQISWAPPCHTKSRRIQNQDLFRSSGQSFATHDLGGYRTRVHVDQATHPSFC